MANVPNPAFHDLPNLQTEAAGAGKYPSRRFNKRERKLLQSALGGTENVLKVTYDFTANGGAIGTFDLGSSLPAAALITSVVTDCIVAPTSSGSATITLNVPTEGTLTTASTTSTTTGATVATNSPIIKLAAKREVQASIAVAALTAGKLTWFIRYIISTST